MTSVDVRALLALYGGAPHGLLFAPMLALTVVGGGWASFLLVPLLVHVLLSWHWIVSKPARLIARGSWRSRLNYVINVALFVAMVIAIVSGAVVSRVALPQLGIHTIYDGDWFETHDFWSNVLFVCIGLHLAMNWGWVLAVMRRNAFTAEEAEANESDA